jgi:protein-tyrosine phosphatase
MRKSSEWFKKRVYVTISALGLCVLGNQAFADDLTYDREIHLKGTSNTRDIGGYLTTDMRMLRSGQIIRSENLSKLTDGDFQKLEEMGVKTIVDLRSYNERKHEPTVWKGDNPPQFYHFPIGEAKNDWFTAQRRLMNRNRFTEKQAREHMVKGYQMISTAGPSSYQQLMELVMDESNWPILVHCTAGKDRTGVAISLLMEAVGVDRETIMEEFLLTNDYSRAQAKATRLARELKYSRGGSKLGKSPSASAWFSIIGVQPEMLEAFYASIDENYGSMDAFLTELGVDPDAREALRASLTIEQPAMAMAD